MKPIMTMKKLVNAQQKAIEIYQAYRRLTERDVLKILELNVNLATDDSSIEDHASFGDIRRFVSNIAHKFYKVLKYGETEEEYNKNTTPEISSNYFNYWFKLRQNLAGDGDHTMEDDVLKPHQHDTMLAELEFERRKEYRDKLIETAEKKLGELLLSQGYLTNRDVCNALNIRKDISSHVIIDLQPLDHLDSERIRNEIHWHVVDTYKSVYQPERDLPCELIPARMWSTPGGYTTVEWSDGTKTTVRAENEETATTYGGFCACVAKKLYNRSTDAIGLMNRALDRAAWPAKRKQIEREKLKKMKQDKVEHEKKAREKMIRQVMETKRIEREAERRLEQQKGGGEQ